MKKMTLLLSFLPAISYAHNDPQHGILANIMHSITSPHHYLLALVIVLIGAALAKVFFAKK